jgi:exosortase A-associated hydrolase 2
LNHTPEFPIEPFMLSVGNGYRLCVLRRAASNVKFKGGILYVHPFAEEMNKSRRAVALCSRWLAQDGWTVLQIDLDGCGDSSGDMADATWARWQEDLCDAAAVLQRLGSPLRLLWGLRLGALLATSVIDRMTASTDLLLWQPVLTGKTHLTQFLRLKAAEELIAQASERSGTASLREELRKGASVRVAGYTLNPSLAASIDVAELSLPADYRGHIYWVETARAGTTELAPVSAQRVSSLVAAGHAVTARAVAGPAFWQTVEIEEAPTLVSATAHLLNEAAGSM